MKALNTTLAALGFLAAGGIAGCTCNSAKPSANLSFSEKVCKLAELTERSGSKTKEFEGIYQLKGPGDIIDNQSGPRFIMHLDGKTKQFMLSYNDSNFKDTVSYFDNVPYGTLDGCRVFEFNGNPRQKEQQEYENAINGAYNSINKYQLR